MNIVEIDLDKLKEYPYLEINTLLVYQLLCQKRYSDLEFLVDIYEIGEITLKVIEDIGYIKVPWEKGKYLRDIIPYIEVLVEKEEKVEDWIQDWRSLFPKGVKTSGYPVRGSKGGCIKKMKKFMKEHPDVTKEQIYEATKNYIEKKRREGYSCTKVADHFIEKDKSSILESYIEELGEEEENSSIKEDV